MADQLSNKGLEQLIKTSGIDAANAEKLRQAHRTITDKQGSSSRSAPGHGSSRPDTTPIEQL